MNGSNLDFHARRERFFRFQRHGATTEVVESIGGMCHRLQRNEVLSRIGGDNEPIERRPHCDLEDVVSQYCTTSKPLVCKGSMQSRTD